MSENHESREEYRKRLEKRIHDQVEKDRAEKRTFRPKRKFNWKRVVSGLSSGSSSQARTPQFNNSRPTNDRNLPEVHHYRTPSWVKNIIWALVIFVLLGGGY